MAFRQSELCLAPALEAEMCRNNIHSRDFWIVHKTYTVVLLCGDFVAFTKPSTQCLEDPCVI